MVATSHVPTIVTWHVQNNVFFWVDFCIVATTNRSYKGNKKILHHWIVEKSPRFKDLEGHNSHPLDKWSRHDACMTNLWHPFTPKPFPLHAFLCCSPTSHHLAITYNCASNEDEITIYLDLGFYVVVGLIGWVLSLRT
jgi:hypothetical protein